MLLLKLSKGVSQGSKAENKGKKGKKHLRIVQLLRHSHPLSLNKSVVLRWAEGRGREINELENITCPHLKAN